MCGLYTVLPSGASQKASSKTNEAKRNYAGGSEVSSLLRLKGCEGHRAPEPQTPSMKGVDIQFSSALRIVSSDKCGGDSNYNKRKNCNKSNNSAGSTGFCVRCPYPQKPKWLDSLLVVRNASASAQTSACYKPYANTQSGQLDI